MPGADRRWRLAMLATAVVLAGITASLAGTRIPSAVTLATGLLMTLVVPGFSVLAAMAPRLRLTLPERALATVATSICADIICGLVVGGTRLGLTSTTVSLALTAITFVGAGVAAAREVRSWRKAEPVLTGTADLRPRSLEAEEALTTAWYRARRWAPIAGASAVLTVGILAGAIVYSQRSAAASHGVSYLSLSAVPTQRSGLRVAVTSYETLTVTVRVTVVDGRTTIASWVNVVLKPGQSWSRSVILPSSTTASAVRTSLFVGTSTVPDEQTTLAVS